LGSVGLATTGTLGFAGLLGGGEAVAPWGTAVPAKRGGAQNARHGAAPIPRGAFPGPPPGTV